jgi:hypothetical protein
MPLERDPPWYGSPEARHVADVIVSFGERDHTIHDDMMDLAPGRRNGYGWFVSGPSKALAAYATWSRAHPVQARRDL